MLTQASVPSEAGSPKTYKREVAVGLAVASHAAAGWLLWGLIGASQWDTAKDLVGTLITADMLFVMGAFGLDAALKQRTPGK